ncbi:MAG: class I SAM-dependent methyltransferase [Gammaproteobacteria bacterium]|nr:class I SAM-dependent methyltransferase [Gammaproteobacteria bacterium]NIR82463.1 class I SAM-dependent methyltransferase [Gammaproteobacteria bacterium]NIR88459.1 class I SAM-dependent methyltransferase [Gammaproteobacteria bacterium]NIU03599.1 class I SAM-dependent methyltransferase [Gammaproteobacteria bacterium]NIV73721.1 methyltransferase domain-containing protein [Gammaproteobacteria bacterium]
MSLDQEKQERFVEHALGDLKGGMMMLMTNLGDRLGLFHALAERPMTSRELADATRLHERYVREWLSSVTCGGYVEYDPQTQTYTLPPEHAPVLVDAKSPVFFCGLYQEMAALWQILPKLKEKFRNGGGLAIEDYSREWWDGMERFTATWFENFLLQEWIPKANGLKQRLHDGAHVADVGCGRGQALVKLAETFPKMTAVGYDLSDTNLEGAKRLARDAGVADRIRFRKHDVHDGLPDQHDIAMTFDAVHDFKDPQRAFEGICRSLSDDGTYLLLEFRVGEHLEDNLGPIGAMFYAWSVTYCMTTSLGMGGVGLGTCGMSESVVRKLADRAGFTRVEVVPFDNPFNKLYLAEKQAP